MTSPLSRVGAQSGFETALPPDTVLDTDSAFAQRQYTFQFDLVEAKTGATIRTLHPRQDSVPTLSHDTTRVIKRTLNLELDVADTTAVDTIKDRVRVKMVMPNGTTYPLGRYMFTDNTRALYTSGRRSSLSLMDEMFIVDTLRETAFPFRYPRVSGDPSQQAVFDLNRNSNNVASLVTALLQIFTTFSFRLEDTVYVTDASWSLGTSNAQVLSDLALYGDYFDPWFSNDEQLHLIRAFDPATRVPDIDWDRYLHVYADTITDTDDVLSAANRFIVISNNVNAGNQVNTPSGVNVPVVGRYDVPLTAPHSIYNRGFVLPDIRQLQVSTQQQALAIATNIGITNTVYERMTMDTWADPRHDSYNVIRWQQANWLELSWAINLVAGGAMSHTIRRVYS